MTHRHRFAASIAAGALCSCAFAAPPRYVYTDIGFFDERFPAADLRAINNSGEATGQMFVAGPPLGDGFILFVPHAIRVRSGEPAVDIGDDPAIAFGSSSGNGINNAGVIAGEAVFPDLPNPIKGLNFQAPGVIWIKDQFTTFGLPNGFQGAVPLAINNPNKVVGYLVFGQGGNDALRAFLWDQGESQLLAPLPDGRSIARDINDDGMIVGVVNASPQPIRFLLIDNQLIELTGCEHLATPSAINNAGQIVGASFYLWWEGDCVDLPQINAPEHGESPRDINDHGVIVGGGNSLIPALWIDGEMYDLTTLINNTPDTLRPRFAAAINNSGQIVGVASSIPDHGLDRGFFLDPVTPDLTKDGVVDSADLLRLLSAFNSSDPHTDLDGSGVIDGRDLLRVLNDWGPVPVRDPREAFEMFKRTAERQAAERLEAARGPDLGAIDRATRPFAPRNR